MNSITPRPRFRYSAGAHLALREGGITLQEALERFQRDYSPVLKVIAARSASDTPSTFLKLR